MTSFIPFQTLTAAELNSAFAAVTPPVSADLLGSSGSAFTTVSISTGLTLSAGSLLANWRLALVTSIGTGLTLTAGALTPDWQAGTVASLGSGLSLTTGVLSASGTGGTVTSITAGVGLNGGTVTGSGTFTANYQAGTLASFGTGLALVGTALTPNYQAGTLSSFGTGLTLTAGSLTSNYQAGTLTTFHTGLTLSAGTLTPDWNGGVVTVLGDGVGLNSGTIQVDHQATLTGGSHLTITPAQGVSAVIINGSSSAATTLDVGAPLYLGQHLRVQYKNGSTAQAMTLGTSIKLGATVPSFTSTPTAAVSDFLQLIGANGSQWALVAISQGFTI